MTRKLTPLVAALAAAGGALLGAPLANAEVAAVAKAAVPTAPHATAQSLAGAAAELRARVVPTSIGGGGGSTDPNAVPEPGTLPLAALALGAGALLRRRRRG